MMSSPIIYLLFVIVGNALSLTTFDDCYNTSENDYSCSTYPPWFAYDKSTDRCQCGSDLGGIVNYDNANKKIYFEYRYCMTYDGHLGTIAGACITNCFMKNQSQREYYELPSNLSELNKVMCEDLWN